MQSGIGPVSSLYTPEFIRNFPKNTLFFHFWILSLPPEVTFFVKKLSSADYSPFVNRLDLTRLN